MQEKTLSTLISCYQVMLPKALKAKKGIIVQKKYDIFYKLEENNITGRINESQAKILNLFKKKALVEKYFNKNRKRTLQGRIRKIK